MALGGEQQVELSEVSYLLHENESWVALTGAGISSSAGIPIYRGPDGRFLDEGTEEWLQRETFDADPAAWYGRFWELHDAIKNAQPTAGHCALAAMVEAGIVSHIVTQNVDALDLRAGTAEERVSEVHGIERMLSCTDVKGCDFIVPTEEWLEGNDVTVLPTCPNDGLVLKPDFNLYGDGDPRYHRIRPYIQKYGERGAQALVDADGILVVGTSLNIAPWNGIVVQKWREVYPVVMVNPNPTRFDAAARFIIRGTADEGLQMLQEQLVD